MTTVFALCYANINQVEDSSNSDHFDDLLATPDIYISLDAAKRAAEKLIREMEEDLDISQNPIHFDLQPPRETSGEKLIINEWSYVHDSRFGDTYYTIYELRVQE